MQFGRVRDPGVIVFELPAHARASDIDVEAVPLEAATTKQLDLFG